jgi:hypothetical protein
MADRATWAGLVAKWRASGLTAAEFAEEHECSMGQLRHWSSVFGREARAQGARPTVRMARVLRSPTGTAADADPSRDAIVIELGRARVSVRNGVDRATLATVLDVLADGGGAA